MSEDLTILPLKTDKSSIKLKTPINPILPDLENNFVLLIFAPRGSGKTTLYSNLLLNPNFFKRENYQYAFIISSTIYQDLSAKALRDNFGETLYDRYDDSIIDNLIKFQRSFTLEDRPKTILILDDMVGAAKISKVSFGITRFRHDNISCIISTQQSKSVQKVARLNATDVIVGATKNWKEIEDIYTEYGMLFGSLEKWIKIFRYATKEPYSFLYMKIDKKPYRCFKNFTEDITNKYPETSKKNLFVGSTMEDNNKFNEDVDKVKNYKDELTNNY